MKIFIIFELTKISSTMVENKSKQISKIINVKFIDESFCRNMEWIFYMSKIEVL